MEQMTIQKEKSYTIQTNIRRWGNSLAERLEAFYKRPIDEIYVKSTQEVDAGDPKGNEIW